MSFTIIAAIGKNRELGKNGQLLFNIKEDMDFFRQTTMNHQVIMGYNTWKSLPKKLNGRKNLVVSHEKVEGADETVTDLSEYIKKNKDTDEEIFVIGGGMLYAEMIKYANKLYLTEIDAEKDADTFFPDFDKKMYNKNIIKQGKNNDLTYSFIEYTKI